MGLGKCLYELDAMPSSEFTAWQNYYLAEPWGAWRDNWHAALVVRAIALFATGTKVNIADYMYRPAPTPEQQRDRFRAALDAMATKRAK